MGRPASSWPLSTGRVCRGFDVKILRCLAAIAAVAGLSAPAGAQPSSTTGAVAPQECLIAEVIADLCGPKLLGIRIAITDGADSTECGNLGDAGEGSSENLCRWSVVATAWVTDDVAGSGGGGTHPIGAGDYAAGSIEIADIAAAAKSGIDADLITGTATPGECGEYDANGDLIGAGGPCGAGGGETNTHSSEAGGLGLTAATPKVGVDLRLIALDAADFDRTGDVASIDDSKWAKDSELHDPESPASETVAGILETATVAEVDTGTDTGRAVSPGSLAGAALAGELGGTFGAPTVDANHAGSTHKSFTDPVFLGIVTLPFAADPTTNADGEVAVDLDHWAAGYDAIEFWNGTESVHVVATNNAPSDRQVPMWSASGTVIEWSDVATLQDNVFTNEQSGDPGSGTTWSIGILGRGEFAG